MQVHVKVLLGLVLVMIAVLVGASSVSGDTSDAPVTEAPTATALPSPSKPYEIGEGAPWRRTDLTIAEQDLLDRPDPSMPGNASSMYAAAAAYQASFANARAANARLGLSGFEETGVVP